MTHSHQNTTQSSFTSWFNTIKANDIDDGLAADFDGSLSGLGVELGSTTYNMSEALLALPVFKQEAFDHGLKKIVEEGKSLLKEIDTEPSSALDSSPVPPVYNFTSSERFQYILGASTSPATKVNEETLTYLNQGQSYEVKLKRMGQLGDLHGKLIKSRIRVIFHERRLQYTEREQLDTWRTTRPGERILDIDIPLSYGICDVVQDVKRLNCLEFVWDPAKEVGVYIKVNCISTEFTAKKHGGEKGVPFRLQVETYIMENDDSTKLVHCASCQVKVFKPKGADRKNKTDREKVEKRSPSDKDKYQPSYECTVLTEIPVDQVQSYLDQLIKQDDLADSLQQQTKNLSKTVVQPTPATTQPQAKKVIKSPSATITALPAGKVAASKDDSSVVRNFACLSDSSMSNESSAESAKDSVKRMICSGSAPNLLTQVRVSKPKPPPPRPKAVSPEKVMEPLLVTAAAKEVTQWLQTNRFNAFIRVFQNFSGADLMRLSRDDLIQICGLADGIRLNNALQAKALRPKLTLYVCQMTGKQRVQQTGDGLSGPSPSTSPSLNSSYLSQSVMAGAGNTFISPAHFIAPHTAAPPDKEYSFKVIDGQVVNMAGSKVKEPGGSSKQSGSSQSHPVAIPVMRSSGDKSSPVFVQSAPGTYTIVAADTSAVTTTFDSNTTSITHITPLVTHGTPVKSPSKSDGGQSAVKLTAVSSKRQYREAQDDDEDSEEIFYKKQRTRNLELPRTGVYHALYLDHLTCCDLKEKISTLFSVEASQIKEIFVQGPSGIHVLVTDEVVQNFVEETRYIIEAIQDEDSNGVCPGYLVYLRTS